jgi:hypothetical protein
LSLKYVILLHSFIAEEIQSGLAESGFTRVFHGVVFHVVKFVKDRIEVLSCCEDLVEVLVEVEVSSWKSS